ncbi:MAG: Gfo/Idh/MocA family oxidoreductase [Oscillospiraceae bacterium]
MKGIVVGLGSMGKRRIRLMEDFFENTELCGVDSSKARRDEAHELFGISCYVSISQAVECFKPECGFVCTSPLSHGSIINELLQDNLNVFTEINLVSDRYVENAELAKDRGLTLFLSSTPLYRRETQYIEQAVRAAECPLIYRYHVGQYLPDWHPWENYKDFFVGDRRTGGCRELFGIELPWLVSAFGEIAEVYSTHTKQTSLSIDYPDSFLVTVTHKSGTTGQLAFNVVSRKAVRDLEVIGEKLYLHWGGTPTSLSIYDFEKKQDIQIDTYESVNHDTRYSDNIVENAYVDELAAFFDTLEGKNVRRHSFEQDAELLDLIDEIEKE